MKTKISFIMIILILLFVNISFILFDKTDLFIAKEKITTNESFLIELQEELPEIFILFVDYQYITTCGTSNINDLTKEQIVTIATKSRVFMDLLEIKNNFDDKVYDNYLSTLKGLFCS